MKSDFYKKNNRQAVRLSAGFSLAEAVAALTIGAMILVAVLAIYDRTETATASVISKLDELRLPSEVLQRIAEDLDRLAFGRNTKITVQNKLTNLYQSARLEILKTYYDKSNKKQTLEKIVWVAAADPDDDGLILYRSHSGVTGEDKLLDSEKEDWQRQLFVPICSGVTFFKIEIPSGDDFHEGWTNEKLPNGLRITISFAIPFKTPAGKLETEDEDKITRMIAVDRTRKIEFTIIRSIDEDPNQPELDINEE